MVVVQDRSSAAAYLDGMFDLAQTKCPEETDRVASHCNGGRDCLYAHGCMHAHKNRERDTCMRGHT